jgi:hypothetical protein
VLSSSDALITSDTELHGAGWLRLLAPATSAVVENGDLLGEERHSPEGEKRWDWPVTPVVPWVGYPQITQNKFVL